ncbi:MAG: hypothetical protein RL656_548 [Bacteroidota bacterium]
MIPFSGAQFQIFYQDEMVPVLSQLNKHRFHIIGLLGILCGVFILGLLLQVFLGLFVLTLLFIGGSLYGFYYVATMWLNFKLACQYSLTSLMMKYFMQTPEIMNLSFRGDQCIDSKIYLESGFFSENVTNYEGNGLMTGNIGEVSFSLSKLRVSVTSNIDGQLKPQFNGFFIHGKLPFKTSGAAIIWSRREKQEVYKAIRKFTWLGAENKDDEQSNALFKESFATYASPDTPASSILSEDIKDLMIRFYKKTGRALFFSFVENDVFVAVSAPENLLTMPLFKKFRPDISILTFLDIHLVLFSILQEFDFHQ